MTAYAYRASTREGKVIEGSMDAAGEAAVVSSLRAQGYLPLSVTEGPLAAGRRAFSLRMTTLLRGFVSS